MSKRRAAKNAVYSGVILVLVLVMIFSGLRILESTVFNREQSEEVFVSKTITRDGVEYFPRQDITVMLVMGIDEKGPAVDSGSYNNGGAADAVFLVIFDEKNEECRVLNINRDTMLEMPVLGIGGKQAGTFYGQLALSHTYGSGLEDSCENTRATVSNFLYGINIDYYVSMNIDAISILNDAIGGVTVNVTEDFSQVDPSIGMGEVTLNGEQAISYVQTRKGVGDQLNVSRMERQKEYINSFLDTFFVKQEQESEFVLSVYEEVSPYIVTDCSATNMSKILEKYAHYEIVEIVSPKGENHLGNEYYEFYVDEAALDELILRLFYAPK